MAAPEFLKPLIDLLPQEAQDFLNAGGWLAVAALLGLIVLLVLLSMLRKLLGLGGRRRHKADAGLTEDLATYPPPPALWGNRRLTLYDLPIRIRLIVAAPLGRDAGDIRPDEMEAILDRLVPGLGQVARGDKPRMRCWPTQLSYTGFQAAFRRHTLRPGPEDQVSRWVLLVGKALVDRRPIAMGFAFLADHDNTLNRVFLEHAHQWMEALRLKTI